MIRKQIATTSARRLIGLCGCLTVLAVVSIGARVIASPIIVDSHGFEQPLFTTTFAGSGTLEGQTPATFNGTWLRDKAVGTSTAIVQTAIVAPGGGTQAVRVDKAANESKAFWGVPVSGYPSNPPNFICIDWDMRVEGPAGNPSTQFGPFFGVKAYDTDATNPIPGFPAGNALLGSLGVDATTGEVLYQDPAVIGGVQGSLEPLGPTVAFGAWNHYGMELNFNTHTYRMMVNNVQAGPSFGFVDSPNFMTALDSFTDAPIETEIAAAGAMGATTGTAYFDNFKVEDGPCPVPEPSTIALAAIGVSGLWLGRRRHQS